MVSSSKRKESPQDADSSKCDYKELRTSAELAAELRVQQLASLF